MKTMNENMCTWSLNEAMQHGITLEDSKQRVEKVINDHYLLTADEFIAQMEPRIRSLFHD